MHAALIVLYFSCLPGAKWPGAVIANAFMIHGLRAACSVVAAIVMVVLRFVLRCSNMVENKELGENKKNVGTYMKYDGMHAFPMQVSELASP